MNSAAASRAAAAKILQQVLQHGRSLSQAIPNETEHLEANTRAFAQAICYQVLRQLPSYEWLIAQLIEKPLKSKVRIVHYLLLVGLCQLRDMRVPAHAAIAETVEACIAVRQKNLKGMVNAVLRSYQRQQEALETQLAQLSAQTPALAYNHPGWLLKRLQNAYPQLWPAICEANNIAPPLWLRVNTQHHSPAEYLAKLKAAGIEAYADKYSAIQLAQGIDVTQLPGFAEGHVSVQDRSAQFAAHILAAEPGMRVLDACAAPGGKTVHLLEHTADIQVTAIDFDASRLQRVHENLTRMRVRAEVICGDAANPEEWWDGQLFDRILLDAPCSATGVIRRHPDIKWLRRADDIDALVELQSRILSAQWQLLKPGGRLLYATCSVLPEENILQIQSFLATVDDAEAIAIPIEKDTVGGAEALDNSASAGWQLLPGAADTKSTGSTGSTEGGDGFFYFLLQKRK
ncbi:ribosomal RNA small subunit methyltransferase RsmB [Idiomarina sp. A28L]|uniref:16S rRNA (cytosine(967)-C(5))-methyltransferase RsmB n=1 Tax=Idiomarina sp. A28L TaxID=1036674 RepID=UPI0002138C97|nr:16S rRNA (cytosine(967)-C(5))-methyltransferase RsmB [Idiomarina sp. A28L]EGN76035.1 ribosomal RNA small subunit methyltransferase RsmB [Idiomarina sp. A28L]